MESFTKMISEIKELLVNPKGFWNSKKVEEESGRSLFLKYLVPMFSVLAIAVFIGEFFKRSDFFFEYPILKALRELLLFVLYYFISVFFTKELMKTFGGEKNTELARKLVAYSIIPFLSISILTGLIEYFSVIKVLGFYSFYLFWIGVETLSEIPDNKKHKYSLIVIFISLMVYSFLGWFLTKIFEFILMKI